MTLQIIGAGAPRTGTRSLEKAFEILLGGSSYHMSKIPNHPFDLGPDWKRALTGDMPDWDQLFDGYFATVDWPASLFWRELSEAYPDALVLLSARDSADVWFRSFADMHLPYIRMGLAPDWAEGHDLTALMERFAGTKQWDDPALLKAAYERRNAEIRKTIPARRLLEWNAKEGWAPLCRTLGMPVPEIPFPWIDGRSG